MTHLRPSKRKRDIALETKPDPEFIDPSLPSYPRVELTHEEKKAAEADAVKLIQKYGYQNLGKMLGMLAAENARLTKECNEHRAARGFEPMKTYKV